MSDPKELEAVAEAIWKAQSMANQGKAWAEQPEHVKAFPRILARAALEAVSQFRNPRP